MEEEKNGAKKEESQERKEHPKRSKLTSAKLWITLWAIMIITFIVIGDRAEFTDIAQWLCAVPLAYIGANVWQKKIFEDGQKWA